MGVPVRAKARRLSESMKESAYMMSPDTVGPLILDRRFLFDIWEVGMMARRP
jgi:hypothetical protein